VRGQRPVLIGQLQKGQVSGMAGAEVERLRTLVEPVVQRAGYDLEGLTVTPAGARRQLRIVVDSDNGVDLDAVAAISRAVSEQLDATTGAQDPMGSLPYTLEVSSPGIGSALTQPRHFRRAAGRLVSVQLSDGAKQTWRVLAADDAAVTFLLGASSTQQRAVPYGDIARAAVDVEFSPPNAAVRELLAEHGADRSQAVVELDEDEDDLDADDADDDADDADEPQDGTDEPDDTDDDTDEEDR
jgi:ribosome maturation factor RimP